MARHDPYTRYHHRLSLPGRPVMGAWAADGVPTSLSIPGPRVSLAARLHVAPFQDGQRIVFERGLSRDPGFIDWVTAGNAADRRDLVLAMCHASGWVLEQWRLTRCRVRDAAGLSDRATGGTSLAVIHLLLETGGARLERAFHQPLAPLRAAAGPAGRGDQKV